MPTGSRWWAFHVFAMLIGDVQMRHLPQVNQSKLGPNSGSPPSVHPGGLLYLLDLVSYFVRTAQPVAVRCVEA